MCAGWLAGEEGVGFVAPTVCEVRPVFTWTIYTAASALCKETGNLLPSDFKSFLTVLHCTMFQIGVEQQLVTGHVARLQLFWSLK